MANVLPVEKKIAVVSMLCEGSSIRAVERITGIHRDTIMRLGVRMGVGAYEILNEKMRGLPCENIQVDEIWGFIGAKKKTVKIKGLDPDFGDVWTWIAIDADTKIVPCFVIGDRSKVMADILMSEIADRTVNRLQISTDALPAYQEAVVSAFGTDVDYGTVVKSFTHTDLEATRRYSPPDVLKVEKKVVWGSPEKKKISTSFVEKQHHTLRMHCRRLTRLTNAFSKKRENFEAAVALYYVYYNFVKSHGTLGCTPAMAAGIENNRWKVADLVEMIEA